MTSGWPSSLGWPGALALLALVLATLLRLGAVPAWQQQALAQRHVEARPAPVAAAPAAEPPLPAAGDPSDRAADLLALALRHGIRVDRTQQRLSTEAGIEQLKLGMAAHGGYADLRRFVAAALQADPALALDRLQWRRASDTSAELDADLQWALLRGPAAAAEARR